MNWAAAFRWQGVLGVVALALGVALAPGCASTKHKGRSAGSQKGQETSTNRFDSSAALEAQAAARTNAAPTKAADNTAQNKTDDQADTLTPLDQGNSDQDRRITQELRKSVVFGSGGQHFSFAAKNIKIITVNREVTLRGVVATPREKESIGALAQKIPGVQKVNNQLTSRQGSR